MVAPTTSYLIDVELPRLRAERDAALARVAALWEAAQGFEACLSYYCNCAERDGLRRALSDAAAAARDHDEKVRAEEWARVRTHCAAAPTTSYLIDVELPRLRAERDALAAQVAALREALEAWREPCPRCDEGLEAPDCTCSRAEWLVNAALSDTAAAAREHDERIFEDGKDAGAAAARRAALDDLRNAVNGVGPDWTSEEVANILKEHDERMRAEGMKRAAEITEGLLGNPSPDPYPNVRDGESWNAACLRIAAAIRREARR